MIGLHFFEIFRGEGGDGLFREEVVLYGRKLKEVPKIDRVRVSREHRRLTFDAAEKRTAHHRQFRYERADLHRIISVFLLLKRVRRRHAPRFRRPPLNGERDGRLIFLLFMLQLV